MVEQPYEAKAVLRRLLADDPNLLAGARCRAQVIWQGSRRWNGRAAVAAVALGAYAAFVLRRAGLDFECG